MAPSPCSIYKNSISLVVHQREIVKGIIHFMNLHIRQTGTFRGILDLVCGEAVGAAMGLLHHTSL